MLTTGGGWQDQIGGLVPGVKIGISEGKLPVKIETKIIKVSPTTIKALNERMVLVFTGRPRLARNLLQVRIHPSLSLSCQDLVTCRLSQ